MAFYIEINNNRYLCNHVSGRMCDSDWNDRQSKTINSIEMDYNLAKELFVDNVSWKIVSINEYEVVNKKDVEVTQQVTDAITGEIVLDENGEPLTETVLKTIDEVSYDTQEEVYDNSDFCLVGDMIIHRDGTLSIKMGKLTDLEEAYERIYGGY